MSEPDSIASRLVEVEARIARAAAESGRARDDVTLVAVTKTVDVARVRAALAAGAVDLGENRAQELVAKAAELDGETGRDGPTPRWHFVGRLQRNKVRMLAGLVYRWHSVDRAELVAPLARHAPGAGVYVEVNLSAEPQKGGCRPEETAGLVDALADSGLQVEGLMTVPAAEGDPRPAFAALRDLAARLGLPGLSMGMTGDFEAAIAEGSTVVRIGSAIFGPRPGGLRLRR